MPDSTEAILQAYYARDPWREIRNLWAEGLIQEYVVYIGKPKIKPEHFQPHSTAEDEDA